MATDSWHHPENTAHLRHRLPVVQSIREDAQSQHLNVLDRFLACLTVSQHSRQFRYFRQPTAIVFLLDFNGQRHDSLSLRRPFRPGGILQRFFGFCIAFDVTGAKPEGEE